MLHFKGGFSKLRSTFHTWRLIVDDGAYRELVAQKQAQSAWDAPTNGFFPAYRMDSLKSVGRAEKQEASAARE